MIDDLVIYEPKPIKIVNNSNDKFVFLHNHIEYQIDKKNGFYLIDRKDFGHYCWDAQGLKFLSDGLITPFNSITFDDMKNNPFCLDVNLVAGRRVDLGSICKTMGDELSFKAYNGWGTPEGVANHKIISACNLGHALYKLNEEAKEKQDDKWSIYRMTKPGNLGIFENK